METRLKQNGAGNAPPPNGCFPCGLLLNEFKKRYPRKRHAQMGTTGAAHTWDSPANCWTSPGPHTTPHSVRQRQTRAPCFCCPCFKGKPILKRGDKAKEKYGDSGTPDQPETTGTSNPRCSHPPRSMLPPVLREVAEAGTLPALGLGRVRQQLGARELGVLPGRKAGKPHPERGLYWS